jgi:hypothetical protein
VLRRVLGSKKVDVREFLSKTFHHRVVFYKRSFVHCLLHFYNVSSS